MMGSRKRRTSKLLSAILILSLIFSLGLSALALGQADTDEAKQQVPFVKTPGTFPIVEVTVTGTDALEALFDEDLDLDILGYECDGDEFAVAIMIHGDELEYFEANGIYYVVIDDGTYIFETPVSQSAKFAGVMGDGSPIPGMPERENPSPTANAPLPLPPGTQIEPDKVFDPTGISFNEKWGFPDRLGYRTVTEFYAEMNYLAQAYPELVKLHVYGESFEGVPLYAIEVSNNPGGNDGRPATLHQAGNHAREWPSNERCMDMAWYLITKYGEAGYEDVTELLDTTACWFLPMTNPDGVHWDMLNSPGSWRHNRNNYAGTPFNPDGTIVGGVDLNRNYAYGWGSSNGSQTNFGQSTFRGSEPFSEPEIMAVSEVFRSNMIFSSVSGHTSGQLILYPWAFFINTDTDRTTDMPIQITDSVTIKDLGRRQNDYSMHADQYTNVMYAYSGESLDYKLGTLRCLPFLYEYGRNFVPQYNGTNQYTATTPYNDAYGNQREFLVTYSTAASAAGAGAPGVDLTAEIVFINAPYTVGYGSGDYGSVEDVNALGDLTGKIVLSHTARASNDNAAIVLAAQAKGAAGVLFCGASDYPHNGGYSHYTPNLGNGTSDTDNPSLITIPVAGTSKPYMREIHEKAEAAGGVMALTLKSTTKPDIESQLWQFERNIGALMENMSFATEFASHITGTIRDSKGELIPEATLTLEKEVVSVLVEGNLSANATHDNIFQSGELKQDQTAVYEVEGGVYDWSVTPSKQLDNPLITAGAIPIVDEGYTITASAPGKKSVTMENVKISDYQTTIELDIVLEDDVAVVELSGPETVSKGSDAEYLLSIGNLEDLATMTVTFEVEGKYFVGKEFTGLNGLQRLAPTQWTDLGDGVWQGRATLWSPTGIYSEDLLDLFKMAFTAKDETGDTSLTITGLLMTGYNGGASQYIDYEYKGGVNSLPIKIGIRFDVNGDGVLDQRDLTDAQYYYKVKAGDSNWEQAKRADVNGDGVVDAEDFILILMNIQF